jgi:hypothetical protein
MCADCHYFKGRGPLHDEALRFVARYPKLKNMNLVGGFLRQYSHINAVSGEASAAAFANELANALRAGSTIN